MAVSVEFINETEITESWEATDVAVVSDTELTCTVPDPGGYTGAAMIKVTTAGGNTTKANLYTYADDTEG